MEAAALRWWVSSTAAASVKEAATGVIVSPVVVIVSWSPTGSRSAEAARCSRAKANPKSLPVGRSMTAVNFSKTPMAVSTLPSDAHVRSLSSGQ